MAKVAKTHKEKIYQLLHKMQKKFTKYSQVVDFLDSLGFFHMELDLSRVKIALNNLKLVELSFYSVHIVGTNGKGSTATFLESLARTHGLRTGRFTSPPFVSPKERIRINALPLCENLWPNLAEKVHQANASLTYFEFLTVLAILAFSLENIDIAIFEAGLGGHYDATCAIEHDLLCLTPISMDHEQVLGNTLKAIAQDKTQAITKNKPVFTANQDEEVMDIIKEVCIQRHAPLHLINYNTCYIKALDNLILFGLHQKQNATLALSAWQNIAENQNLSYNENKTHHALINSFIAGRLQYIDCKEDTLPQKILLDGAHNIHGLQTLTQYLQNCDIKPAVIIFSCLSDKQYQIMLENLKILHELCEYCPILFTEIQNNERALKIDDMETFFGGFHYNVYTFDNLHLCLKHAKSLTLDNPSAPVLICGSLYLLGEFFEKYPHYLYLVQENNDY